MKSLDMFAQGAVFVGVAALAIGVSQAAAAPLPSAGPDALAPAAFAAADASFAALSAPPFASTPPLPLTMPADAAHPREAIQSDGDGRDERTSMKQSPVPELQVWPLMAAGLGFVVFIARRRRRG